MPNKPINGSNFKDATVYRDTRPGYEHIANTNYGTFARISSSAWTHSGSPTYYRTLMQFNLASIPGNAIVQSATLYLYSDPTVTSTSAADGNSQLSGSNAFYLEKITAGWGETTATWNNQPTTTTTGRIWVGPSSSTTENRQIDVKALVQGWVNTPATNYGIKMTLETESHYRSRNYGSTNHGNSAIRPKLVVTYTTEPDPVKDRMDHIFGALNQSYINTGILTDYGMDLADPTLFDGVIRTNNVMDMSSWRALYGSLLSSVINPSSSLIHLKTINQNLDGYWGAYDKNNPTVDIPALFVAYQQLKLDAISQNLISVSGERLYDVAGRPNTPYLTKYAFAAAPNIGYDEDGQVTFIFRSSLFVNSSSKTFSSFRVDFGNGAGYQTMTVNSPKNINYTSAGIKTLKFRVQFTDGSTYESHAQFRVASVTSTTSTRFEGNDESVYIFPRAQDPNCPEPGFPNPEPWQGSFSGATVTVEYGRNRNGIVPGCNPQLIRPLIVVEGYDVSGFSAFRLPNRDFEDFINGRFNGGINIDIDPGPGITNLGDELEAANYDLIFVDFTDGTGDIVRNAFLLENIIRWVNAHKINDERGNRQENVILGQSMGGLVARYAVCDLEKRFIANPTANPDQETRLLVTQDSPHRGANVPLGYQALVNELAPMKLTKIGLATYGSTGAIVGSFLELKDIVPVLKQADELLDEPASQQMLVVQDGRTNTFLNGAYRTMVTLPAGHTPTFRMVALSNGSECGAGQTFIEPGGELLFAEGNLYVNRLLFFLAVETAGGAASLHPGLGVVTRAALYAFTPFVGRNWKTKYIVRATPATGTNQAFYGRIGFEKKILFLVPVNITLFDKTRNSTAGTLPWDSAPGGYYWLGDVTGSVPGNPAINAYPIIDVNLVVDPVKAFSFVPLVSALDIANNPIPAAALTSVFTNGTNATYPSRFASFVPQEFNAGEVNGSPNNSRHVQFTPRNAQWLLEELAGVIAHPANSCAHFCNGTPSSPGITGPLTVCTSNTTFNAINIPAGVAINWTRTPNLTYVSGQGTTNYTVRSNGSGQGNVRLTLTNGCGTPPPLQHDISVGAFTAGDLGLEGPAGSCAGSWVTYRALPPGGHQTGYTYSWTWPSGWTRQSQSQNSIVLSSPSGSSSSGGVVNVSVNNGCGASPAIGRTVYSYPCSSSLSASNATIYPNPAGEELTIQWDESLEEGPKTIRLTDSSQKVVANASTSERIIKMDIRDLPSGLYILTIEYKGGKESHHIVIE